MRFFKIYGRVLGILGADRKLALLLGFANILVAGLSFLDPLLFGRVIELLTKSGEMDRAVVGDERPEQLLLLRREFLLLLFSETTVLGLVLEFLDLLALVDDRLDHIVAEIAPALDHALDRL